MSSRAVKPCPHDISSSSSQDEENRWLWLSSKSALLLWNEWYSYKKARTEEDSFINCQHSFDVKEQFLASLVANFIPLLIHSFAIITIIMLPTTPTCLFSVMFVLFLPSAAFALATATSTTATSIVTGANGYVGRAIVHELLAQGRRPTEEEEQPSILCLVRSHRVTEETEYWKQAMPSERADFLQVLPYDMLDGGKTLRAALDKCNENGVCVYHVASVFGPTEDHKETALQNVKGTCDVLETVHRWRKENNNNNPDCPCKVLVTSSMAAVRGTGQEPKNGKCYTAEDWNTASVLGANWGASYQWSKMESELKATQLAKEYDIPLVTLCPSFVFGPPYGESSSFSIQLVRQWAKGESPVQSRLLVDIRDVAKAHVMAGQSSKLQSGRLILSTDARVSSRMLADWIREVTAPQYRERIHSDDEFKGGAIPIGQQEVDAEGPLREALGTKLRTIQETMQDMTVRLLRNEIETATVPEQ